MVVVRCAFRHVGACDLKTTKTTIQFMQRLIRLKMCVFNLSYRFGHMLNLFAKKEQKGMNSIKIVAYVIISFK